jgi:hypothetical protein
VLTFIGHGVEVEGQGYLVPLEGDLQQPDSLIPIAWLYEQLGRCQARQKLLILDIAHFDPEHGMPRQGGGPLSARLDEQLRNSPPGVQVWLSCSAGQHSYEVASSGLIGSAFLHFLLDFADLKRPENRRLLVDRPGRPGGSLPLVLLAEEINRETARYIKDRWNAEQRPQLFGGEGAMPEPVADDSPPPPVTIKTPPGQETPAEPQLVEGIVRELNIILGNEQVSRENLPPFWAKALEPYRADYAKEEEFHQRVTEHPLRKATLETAALLAKHDQSLPRGFRFGGNDVQFKKMIEREQETPAIVYQELSEGLAALEQAGKARATEPSRRWQAHYDLVYVGLLAKMARTQEFNYILGNKLRKDSPIIQNPQNNGWALIPQEEMQQKETRDLVNKRLAILDRLIQEHPGTPWEVLARSQRSTYLGLTVQEAKIE